MLFNFYFQSQLPGYLFNVDFMKSMHLEVPQEENSPWNDRPAVGVIHRQLSSSLNPVGQNKVELVGWDKNSLLTEIKLYLVITVVIIVMRRTEGNKSQEAQVVPGQIQCPSWNQDSSSQCWAPVQCPGSAQLCCRCLPLCVVGTAGTRAAGRAHLHHPTAGCCEKIHQEHGLQPGIVSRSLVMVPLLRRAFMKKKPIPLPSWEVGILGKSAGILPSTSHRCLVRS